MEKLSTFIYSWVLDKGAPDWKPVFSNGSHCGHGMLFLLWCLLIVAAVVTVIYYFVVSRKQTNATRSNFLICFGLGALALVLLNFLVLSGTNFDGHIFTSLNMWKVTFLDLPYYVIITGLFSWFAVPVSKSNIHWLNIFN